MTEDANITTTYKHLYRTKQLPQWRGSFNKNQHNYDNLVKQNLGIEDAIKEHTILLTADQAKYYTDTNRVGWKGRFDYSMLAYEDTKARESAPLRAYLSDPNRLLECAITTIILIANKQQVPQMNYVCTDLYLKNIRDENGDHPNNIDSFLKFLIYQKNIGTLEPYNKYKPNIPLNLTVTKLSIPCKNPVRKPCSIYPN